MFLELQPCSDPTGMLQFSSDTAYLRFDQKVKGLVLIWQPQATHIFNHLNM